MEALVVGMGEGGGVGGSVEPFVGEDCGDNTSRARDGSGKAAGAEGGAIDEEVELVGGVATIATAVESDGGDTVLNLGNVDGHHRHCAFADDDAGKVDKAVGGEAILVELAEEGIGAVLLAQGLPMEADKVSLFHIRRELGDQGEVAAVRLLRLGLRIGHMGRHSTLALTPVPGVVYLIAEFAALGVAVFSCHNDNDNGKIGRLLPQGGQGVRIPLSCSWLALPIPKQPFRARDVLGKSEPDPWVGRRYPMGTPKEHRRHPFVSIDLV